MCITNDRIETRLPKILLLTESEIMEPALRQNKTRVLQLRVTDAEQSALASLAESRGVSTSEYHRRLLREAISCGAEFFPDDVLELQKLRRQVRAVGKNVNQIAKALNTGKVAPDQVRLDSVAAAGEQTKAVADKLALMIDDARDRRVRLRKAAKS